MEKERERYKTYTMKMKKKTKMKSHWGLTKRIYERMNTHF